ncbi:MAG: Coenzyme F420 hydrogenase/dehydrogenase, beta subunit C-terminal domain [Deltaproteobacteria bacterium]|nr:Coenzyme F420 hydrogenase/dehydrogenase, beta subunit C-terminal domain [Deltaproteobacteria bacterium]
MASDEGHEEDPSHNQFKATFKRMMNDVVAAGSCSGCSMCVVTCPYGVIKYNHNSTIPYIAKPKGGFDYCPISETVGCDVCANACFGLGREHLKPHKPEEIDIRRFGRNRRQEERHGITRFICAARSANPNVVANTQDGGAVSEILRCAFEEGIIEGAAVAGPSDNMWLEPGPTVVKSVDELMRSSKSWYTYCPTPLALVEAVDKYKLKKLALVGVPCEVSGYATALGADTGFITPDRGLKNEERQKRHLRQYVESVRLVIGLFCTETYDYDRYIHEFIRGKLGLDPQEVTKVNIKRKVFIDLKDGTRIETPLEGLKVYRRDQCKYCGDFSAEHADISAGGVGTEGWTILIVRSKMGEGILNLAVQKGYLQVENASEFERSLSLLKRFADTKRVTQMSNLNQLASREAQDALKTAN